MFGILCDKIYYDNEKFNYFLNIKKDSKIYFENSNSILEFIIILDYGSKPITDIYNIGKATSMIGTESNSSLIHPIIQIYKIDKIDQIDNRIINKKTTIDIIHFNEDLYAEFNYFDKVLRLLKSYI